MEKQKLLYQQARLHNREAAEMVLQTISASKGQNPTRGLDVSCTVHTKKVFKKKCKLNTNYYLNYLNYYCYFNPSFSSLLNFLK